MTSIIETIHAETQDPEVELNDILHRCVFVSKILREPKANTWFTRERDGYGEDDPVPDYRRGQTAGLLAWRPGLGWIDAPVSESQRKAVGGFILTTGIGQLERDLPEMRLHGACRCPMSAARQAEARRITRLDTELCQVVPLPVVEQVFASVRAGARLWAEALLDANVRGQGSSFTAQERTAAAQVAEGLDALIEQAHQQGIVAAEASAQRKPSGLWSRLLRYRPR